MKRAEARAPERGVHAASASKSTASLVLPKALAWILALPTLCGIAGTTNLQPAAIWDNTARVTTGFGYRDNVTRSSYAPESSAFFNVSADASFMRFAESGAYLTFFVLGDDTQYFDAPSVNYEQFFSGTAQAVTPLGARDEAGAEFTYLFQHQVLDVSETEAVLTQMLVDAHSFTLRTHWKHTLAKGWAAQLEAAGLRQVYNGDDLSDYWEAAGRVSLTRSYGRRSEFSIAYQSKNIIYDSREEYNSSGVPIAGTSLVYWQNEFGAQCRHYWDQQRHWRTTAKLSYMFSRDNGSGYFDYDRLLFSLQQRWTNPVWEIKAGVRVGWYYYRVQEIGGEQLERSYVLLDARIERRLGKRWFLYVLGEHEWNMSNDPVDEFNDWMAGGGVGVEF